MNSSLPGSTDNLYPISEAARILGIHPSTLRLWESQGLISPDRTPGGDRRYRLADLQDLLSRKNDGRLKENGGGVPPEERSYTISEAAQFLGVHPSTLRLWEEQRLVTPSRTPGGDRRFSFRQLEDILRRQSDGRRKAEEIKVAEPAPRSYEKIKVRQLEHYQLPSRTRLAATRVFILGLAILVSWFVWNSVPDLTRERVKRAFVPDIDNPIVDVNDALEYVVENDRVAWLKSKFPFLTYFLKVSQDALFNTARFLGTVFFGNGDDYFISPTGDASFNSVNSGTISVTSLNVENLTVTGTTTGVTGTGGGGGLATGGDADTLEGQPGSYYLDLGNEIGTCANCLTTAEIDESTLSISAANADTLDFLDSLQFLRSDTNDSFIAGTLTFNGGTTLDLQGTILNSTGSVTFSDDVDILGDLMVSGLTIANGDVTLGDTAADTITFTGVVSSDILPSAAWDFGSAALRWDTGYFDTIDANFIAGTITGSGTNANSWTINQDNLTANAETSSLAVETGTGDFNAVLQWNAAGDPGKFAGYDDNFLFNYPLSLFSQVSGGNQTFTSGSLFNYGQSAAQAITQTGAFTGIDLDFSANLPVPDSAAGDQTGVLITLLDGGASATAIGFQTAGTMDYGLDIGGTVGTADIRLSNGETIDNLTNGTVTVTGDLAATGNLTVTGNNIFSSTDTALTFTGGNVQVEGDLTVKGGELLLTPITSSGSTTEGTIYYDSDNDKLFVYANGAFARLATDMTKYTATDAALANAGYVEIAHNQSTNDLSLTAWYYDSILGQWRTIENFTTTISQDLQNEFDDAGETGFFIDTNSTLEKNLISYWPLNETSAGTSQVNRADAFGTNTLTDNNTTPSTDGIKGNAGNFTTANTEYLSIADNVSLSTGNIDFTVSAWVKLTTKTTSQMIASKCDSGSAGLCEWFLYYNQAADRFYFGLWNTSGGVALATAVANNFGSPSTGVWYHLVGWHDATADTANIKVNNGTANSASYGAGSISDSTGKFEIGAYLTTTLPMDGAIDEVGFWKKILSSQEITDLYNSGNANTYGIRPGFTRTETVGEVGGSSIRISGNLDMGNGTDGAVTFVSSTNINTVNTIAGRVCADGGDAVNYSVTGLMANTATLSSTPSSGCLVANDKVLLINLQGTSTAYTNVGNYEILEIQSISTNTVTFKTNKVNYYGDGANSDANIGTAVSNQRVMLQRISQYTSVIVNTGVNVIPSDWDGTKGGVLAFMANGSVTLNGTGTFNTNGKGYRLGAG